MQYFFYHNANASSDFITFVNQQRKEFFHNYSFNYRERGLLWLEKEEEIE